MMTKEERCRLALGYHRQHYNCGQSVLGAFRDLTGLTEEQCWGLGSGLGSGMRCGGICGAVSGGVLVLGLLHPYTAQEGPQPTPRAQAVGADDHCGTLIVSAVELLCDYLAELDGQK